MAEALYRKYRPQVFEDVVGQEAICRTLQNAIASGKFSHAYLFCGPRGTGKTTTARLVAKALLCQAGPTPVPDGSCEDCRMIADGVHPDVYELDAASRTGVENVREEIIGRVNFAPTRGRYKVYIIDEVHMLSTAAFNALLKTLEEPPEHVVFILCTTDPQKVPETILSRCQRFDFRRIAQETLISRLGAVCEMEGVPYEGEALELIAQKSDGGLRDALTSLEQLIAFGDGNVEVAEAIRLLGATGPSDLTEIVRAIGTYDAASCFRWTARYLETGADLAEVAKDLTKRFRDMYVFSLIGDDATLDLGDAERAEVEGEMAWFGSERLSRLLGIMGDLRAEMKTSTNQRLSFDIALTRMIRPESDLSLESLSERIESIERYLKGRGADVRPEPEMDAAQSSSEGTQVVDAGTGHAAAGDHTDSLGLWDRVLLHLEKKNKGYTACFSRAKMSTDEGGGPSFTIAFGPDSRFQYNQATKPEVRAALKEAFRNAGVEDADLEIVMQTPQDPDDTRGGNAGSQGLRPEDDGMEQTLTSIFGSDIKIEQIG